LIASPFGALVETRACYGVQAVIKLSGRLGRWSVSTVHSRATGVRSSPARP